MQEDLELKENLIEEDEISSLKHFIYLRLIHNLLDSIIFIRYDFLLKG